jgi:hypothetical protein
VRGDLLHVHKRLDTPLTSSLRSWLSDSQVQIQPYIDNNPLSCEYRMSSEFPYAAHAHMTYILE